MAAQKTITAFQWNGKIPGTVVYAQESVQRIVAHLTCGVTTEWMPMVVGWEIGVCIIPMARQFVQHKQHHAPK